MDEWKFGDDNAIFLTGQLERITLDGIHAYFADEEDTERPVTRKA